MTAPKIRNKLVPAAFAALSLAAGIGWGHRLSSNDATLHIFEHKTSTGKIEHGFACLCNPTLSRKWRGKAGSGSCPSGSMNAPAKPNKLTNIPLTTNACCRSSPNVNGINMFPDLINEPDPCV